MKSSKKKIAPMSALARLMEEKEIKVGASHLHIEFFDDDGKKLEYPRDKWYVLIEYQNKSIGNFYFTGIGHRIPLGSGKLRLRHERGRWFYPPTSEWVDQAEAIKRGWLYVPKEGPPIDHIMQAFLTDAQGVDVSFRSWCSDFDSNPDSISHLMIYLKCQEVRDNLLRVFGDKLLKELCKAAENL